VRLIEGMVCARAGTGGIHALGIGGRRDLGGAGCAKYCRDAAASPVGEKAPNTVCLPLRTVRYTDGSAFVGRSRVILEDEETLKRDEHVLRRRSVRVSGTSSGSWAIESEGELSGLVGEDSNMNVVERKKRPLNKSVSAI
jgi:hypothetical protein